MENLGYCGYCSCRFMTAKWLSESVSEQKGDGSWTRSLLSSPKEKWHLCPSAAWNQYSTTGGKWYMGHFPANYECNVKHKQFIFSSEIRTRGRMFFLHFSLNCLPDLLPRHSCPHRWQTHVPHASRVSLWCPEGTSRFTVSRGEVLKHQQTLES